jgi:hypothetical protein
VKSCEKLHYLPDETVLALRHQPKIDYDFATGARPDAGRTEYRTEYDRHLARLPRLETSDLSC